MTGKPIPSAMARAFFGLVAMPLIAQLAILHYGLEAGWRAGWLATWMKPLCGVPIRNEAREFPEDG